MKFKGKIKELNDIIISDPSYGSNVPCRYENKNMDMKDVFVEMQFGTTDFEEDDDKHIHFFIIIKTDENECNLTDEREIKVLKNTKLKQYDIGVDTACFAMGINDYAKEIEDTDSLVNIPIQAEIIKTYHSGKNWYRYIGKITDERLIKKFNKIGITGNDPEDYKKYPNKSLYESALKAREKYDPTIIHFSEFDIVKLLEKNSDKEMEM